MERRGDERIDGFQSLAIHGTRVCHATASWSAPNRTAAPGDGGTMERSADESLDSLLDRLASGQPAPGGGAAAALAGAAAAALAAMVCRVTARHVPSDSLIVSAVERADWLRSRLATLMREDIEAYQGLLDSRRASSDIRASAEQAALRRATVVPLDIARAAASVLELCASVVDLVRPSPVGDLAVATAVA